MEIRTRTEVYQIPKSRSVQLDRRKTAPVFVIRQMKGPFQPAMVAGFLRLEGTMIPQLAGALLTAILEVVLDDEE